MRKINKRTKYKDFLIYFLEYEKNFVKESTYGLYSGYVHNKIIPQIGHLKLKDIDSKVIQDFCTHLVTQGNAITGKGLSHKTTKDIMLYTARSVEYIIKHRKIEPFDVTYKIMCSNEKKPKDIFKENEISKLSNYLKVNHEEPRNIGILITIYTGIRIGELCALKWEDIDFDKRLIHINKTVQRITIKGIAPYVSITPPKSQTGNRKIPINNDLFEVLQENKAHGYILTSSDKLIEPRQLRHHFDAVLKKNEISKRSFHTLRHTFASRLISKTNDFKTVSNLMGHASIQTTLDIYTHISEETRMDCINQF